MITLAVAILMLATAMSTASALLQVLSRPTQRLPYIDNSPMSGSGGRKWLFVGAIVLIAVGSFVYSQAATRSWISVSSQSWALLLWH
jgi:hypothetical protein